jgi:hypothetical protein
VNLSAKSWSLTSDNNFSFDPGGAPGFLLLLQSFCHQNQFDRDQKYANLHQQAFRESLPEESHDERAIVNTMTMIATRDQMSWACGPSLWSFGLFDRVDVTSERVIPNANPLMRKAGSQTE